MAPAAFWRAWSIWAVSVAATAATLSYTALHPLPAKLASQFGSGLGGAVGMVFVAAFATAGALLAWKRPGNPIGWLLSATGLAYAVGVFSVLLAHFPRSCSCGPHGYEPYKCAWTKRATGLEVPRADHVARPGGGRSGMIGGVGRRRGPDHIAGTTSRA